MNSKVEKQEPVAIIGSTYQLLWYRKNALDGLKVGDKLYATPQPCPECKKLKAERAKSESTWESLDNERVQYMNEVGDVLGQNNTDESLIGAAKRAMQTIEFQKKAWSADFVRMTRMEAAIERMRTAGGKDEFQKAFDDAKALL